MTTRNDRIESLQRQAAYEREALAAEVTSLRLRAQEFRSRWRLAVLLTGGLAAAGTVLYRFFGPSSPARRLGRMASLASMIFGVGRMVGRFRKLH
jgi:hypothetical protein